MRSRCHRGSRRGLLLASVGLALALVGGSPASATLLQESELDRGLAVSTYTYGDGSFTSIILATRRATNVRLVVPRGYSIDLDQKPGDTIGSISALLVDAAGSDSEFEDGDLVVQEPTQYASRPDAQMCSPGVHSAVWVATFSFFGGQSVSLPLFVDEAVGSDSSYVIDICPRWEPTAALPGAISAVGLFISVQNVTPPAERGAYVWRADVTPAALGGVLALPEQAFELRALVTNPHRLTLHARYAARTKSVTLSGRLTSLGQPEAGVSISFYSYDERPRSSDIFGPVKTDAAGRFSLQRKVSRTTAFTASAESGAAPHTCTSASSAPGGCLETVSPPQPAYTSVFVRGPRDPVLQVVRADQTRARRAVLKLSDFPEGWEAVDRNPFETSCKGFKLDLSDLTATGEAFSPDFVTDEAGAASNANVFASEADARTAFRRLTQPASVRCQADLYRGAGVENLTAGRMSIPKIGSETRAFRISFTYEDEKYVVDLIAFRRGRLVTAVGFGSENEPLAFEHELIRRLAARGGAG